MIIRRGHPYALSGENSDRHEATQNCPAKDFVLPVRISIAMHREMSSFGQNMSGTATFHNEKIGGGAVGSLLVMAK